MQIIVELLRGRTLRFMRRLTDASMGQVKNANLRIAIVSILGTTYQNIKSWIRSENIALHTFFLWI